uniref:NADH dehydrogenase subunit 2 n=1 Tax=Wormaldia unispina TaxID=2683984 RepID=UPI0022DCDD81|nr:NADH dehydrogenase subunit 2 [Wormaldia unispina]UZZ44455.1 NADH dehydrogenase subunit 2 [Wormaldia unispina]
MINLTNLNFYLILIMSSLFAISSNSWLSCWMGLEINLLSFIPLIYTNNIYNSESMIKYFIIQVLSSSVFLFSIFIMFNKFNFLNLLMLNFSILMKMGSAPMHYWYIQIISGMNWKNCFMLLTWQKIIPLIMLMYNFSMFMMISFVIMNTFFGSMDGLNQMNIRKIMTLSSVNHLGWMIIILAMNETLWILYFSIYSMILSIMIFMFSMMNLSMINQIYFLKNNFMTSFNIMINLLSLGGLPPLLGFFPKWISIQFMIMNNLMLLNMFMILMSLITLYFYIRMTYSILIILNFKTKWINIINNNYMNYVILINSFISIMLLLLISILNF